MTDPAPQPTPLTRRAVLRGGALFLLAPGFASAPLAADAPARRRVRFGLITDLHYADKPAAGTRHYRESLAKLAEAAEHFGQARPAFVAELGDLIDAADSADVEKGYLKRIHKELAALPGDKHYVLGNHCVATLTKGEFLEGVGRERSYYSFDAGGVHFVVLDACFRGDGRPYGRNNFHWTDANLPADQIDWLRADLKKAKGNVVVFAHQRLDANNPYAVKNAADVRKVLEGSGKVLAVFQGHSHKNDYKEIAGIHYCTLVAMVEGSGPENNGYAVADVLEDGTIRLVGSRKQKSYDWA